MDLPANITTLPAPITALSMRSKWAIRPSETLRWCGFGTQVNWILSLSCVDPGLFPEEVLTILAPGDVFIACHPEMNPQLVDFASTAHVMLIS